MRKPTDRHEAHIREIAKALGTLGMLTAMTDLERAADYLSEVESERDDLLLEAQNERAA